MERHAKLHAVACLTVPGANLELVLPEPISCKLGTLQQASTDICCRLSLLHESLLLEHCYAGQQLQSNPQLGAQN